LQQQIKNSFVRPFQKNSSQYFTVISTFVSEAVMPSAMKALFIYRLSPSPFFLVGRTDWKVSKFSFSDSHITATATGWPKQQITNELSI